MDKLQWFKFTPTDWIMGKIQRCPEITQARFMRLICLYWNKECILSYEDAEIEIDKEHLDILISKKIIKHDENFVCIDFLNEQFKEIECSKEDKSTSAKIGNLKRWHKPVYDRFIKNELTLEQALLIAYQSQPDSKPITEQSQNIAEKSREDKDIDKRIIDNNNFVISCLESEQWIETICMAKKITPDQCKEKLKEFEQHLIITSEQKQNKKQFQEHFNNWLKKGESIEREIKGKTSSTDDFFAKRKKLA